MNELQLLSHLNERGSFSGDKAQKLLACMVSEIRQNCSDNDTVAIAGFGSFVPMKFDEAIVMDKSSGNKMLLPPSITVVFKPSVVLRKKLIR
ncbi:MAG: HU family DNA-binding protein [Paramuribaculum sp.]|nr:HU family DNA-binding protein [Paramuribaculum sp.]